MIGSQDPSLALALSSDPAAELQHGHAKIEKLADVTVDDRSFTALKLQREEDKAITTLLIDPKTHLDPRVL